MTVSRYHAKGDPALVLLLLIVLGSILSFLALLGAAVAAALPGGTLA